ncbi:RNA-directed DNA polymerase [Dyadobacter chenhuakuii]|uniref:RNA-directed DNA polymerase n=1 Tax=Dyadobacter chenhuakuii TaxID=2909339 RepID=A0ABY4XGX7_9BACT|nr:RNA-directed DNA polymerase [Dyadobacter chenhuakuii]MCF2495611.1 RNA-directed DNA polymerase [Dyadobacter chenhuakuii]USJ29645.1 RNA-directed DNA polymerase [Dyadobacter chenhuakuii]
MKTERFNHLRKSVLLAIFEKQKIVDVWRKIVKNQLRYMDLKDLYDHYDFNYNIEDRALAIRNEILAGTYKVSQPLIYRIEKKFGVCRHVVIPQPIDALVLQVLVETIAEKILANQPSENAFYSRDKHSVSQPHQVEEYGLSWRKQWKKLQKEIYKFHSEKELIVVTDLSNYYDSIDINELRKVFSSYGKIDEVLIDLLFRILEEISWKPDYLPYSKRGLPTTNIEGIRLLAHSFLFEVDDVLKEKTGNSFTRWMDDIVFGVNSKKEAIETLSAVSDMLKSRGLALNLAKTNIYDEKQGYFHFQIEDNRFLDELENVKVEDEDIKNISENVHASFLKHFEDTSAKYWDKVAKRYITLASRLKINNLLEIVSEKYVDYPGLRGSLLMYLDNIGYTNDTSQVLLKILNTIDIFDDVSLYQICNLVTHWEIPVDRQSSEFLKEFEEKIISFLFSKEMSPSNFYSVLWFKAKYNHHEDLLNFIQKYSNFWQTDSFLRRQVTSVLSRLLIINNIAVSKILSAQISSGINNTVTLANQIFQFSDLEILDKKLSFYLFPEKKQHPYPLAKFLVLCSALNSEQVRNKPEVRTKVTESISDPYYLRWIDVQYNIR